VDSLYAIDPGFDPTDVAVIDVVAPTSVTAPRHG